MYAAILAGGRGRRFWPASRAGRAKQFLDVTGAGSMLAVTWRRLERFIPAERILVLTVRDQLDLVRSELPRLEERNIFAEPAGRNTAPALAVAAAMVGARGGDEPLLCCPSDHLIGDEPAFGASVAEAERAARSEDLLVTFGVAPRYPATGYGYIEIESSPAPGGGARRVIRFHEKPAPDEAQRYLQSGRFLWNCGIFLWRPSVFLSAWKRLLPQGAESLQRIAEALGTQQLAAEAALHYPRLPAVSVDHGILERADNVAVVAAGFDWNDVGSWDALGEVLESDAEGNTGSGEMELIDAKGNILFNPGGITAVVGIENIIVAVDGGRVLVCRRGESQRVRELLDGLERKGRTEYL